MSGVAALWVAAAFAALQAPPGRLPPSPPEAVEEMYRVGGCAADREPARAAEMLSMDFTRPQYRRAMESLLDRTRTCFEPGTRMRFSRLLFAGAVAERLLSRVPSPLNARLARAALLPAVPARSPSDRIAICVVRSVPDDVAALFATEAASAAEAAATAVLDLPVRRCAEAAPRLEVTPAGLRSILATAAFRSASSVGPTGEARN